MIKRIIVDVPLIKTLSKQRENGIVFSGWLKSLWVLFFTSGVKAQLWYTLDHSYRNFLLSRIFSKYGDASVLVVDGVFDWDNTFHNPRLGEKILFAISKPTDIFVLADHLTKRVIMNISGVTSVSGIIKGSLPSSPKLSSFGPGKPILLTTARTPFFSDFEKDRLIELIQLTVQALERLGVPFHVRIFDDEILLGAGLDQFENVRDGSFASVIPNYSALITTPSTISIESMARGLRVAHWNYRHGPASILSAWNLNGSVDLAGALRDFTNPESLGDIFQNEYIREYYIGSLNLNTNEDLERYVAGKSLQPPRFILLERLDFLWRPIYERFIK